MKRRGLVARAMLALVAGYRRWLSPLKRRPTCRFLPTCSEYAAEAIASHGAVRGGVMATGRLLRCNPLCRGGYDPVPPPALPAGRPEEGSCCHG